VIAPQPVVNLIRFVGATNVSVAKARPYTVMSETEIFDAANTNTTGANVRDAHPETT